MTHTIFKFPSIFLLTFLLFGCKKLVRVEGPETSVNSANIYEKDATASSVLTGIYTKLSSNGIQTPALTGLCFYAGLSSDELTLIRGLGNSEMNAYYTNDLNSQTAGYEFWNNIYPELYVVNSALEGISKANTLTPAVKNQLIGEARFMRAFYLFYLVNLYGDVPLILGTDYQKNLRMSRTPQSEVWIQIIEDLKSAQELLSEDYLDATLLTKTTERVRPTKWAATALLARVYLYNKDWKQAEEQSSVVISSPQHRLVELTDVFQKNNEESIWQLQPTAKGQNTPEGLGFIITPEFGLSGIATTLSPSLLNAFEKGDQRRKYWANEIVLDGIKYIYPYKYKKRNVSGDMNFPIDEYSTVMRLGEQYLIRAEALIHQGKISDGIADINLVRNRATDKSVPESQQLKRLSSNLSEDEALVAVEHERYIELCTEWGHRWLDLKRTARIDAIMAIEKPKKVPNSIWNSYQQLFPVWYSEIQRGPNLKQNKGY